MKSPNLFQPFAKRFCLIIAVLIAGSSTGQAVFAFQHSDPVKWVGDQSDCIPTNSDNGAYFDGTNWLNFIVPESRSRETWDVQFDGQFFEDVDMPSSNRLTEIHFGKSRLNYFTVCGASLAPSGIATPDRMSFRRGDWGIHDEGFGIPDIDMEVGTIAPDTLLVGERAKLTVYGNASANLLNVGAVRAFAVNSPSLVLDGDSATHFTATGAIFGARQGHEGFLNVQSGSRFSSSSLVLGAEGNGQATVSGSLDSAFLSVGDLGQGSLSISGDTNIVFDTCIACRSDSSGILSVAGRGSSFSGRRIYVGGTLAGTLPVSGGVALLEVHNDAFLSADEIRVFQNGTFSLSSNSVVELEELRNFGELSVHGQGSVEVTVGTFENEGIIRGDWKISFDQQEVNTGVLSESSTGDSTIRGNLLQNGGIVAPGNSPGQLFIEGDYFLNDGEIQIELTGLDAGSQYDFIDIEGILQLNGGSLDISLLGDYSPSAGDVFQIFRFQSRTGQFNSVNLDQLGSGLEWNLSELGRNGSISVVAVPEPTGLSFVALFGGLIGLRRKRS
jgi:hypothetical protein